MLDLRIVSETAPFTASDVWAPKRPTSDGLKRKLSKTKNKEQILRLFITGDLKEFSSRKKEGVNAHFALTPSFTSDKTINVLVYFRRQALLHDKHVVGEL